MEDPGQLESITAQVEALPELSDGDFLVTADNSSVEAVTAPLQNMNRLVSLLILLAVVVGGIVLYLVLASRVRERMGESGILLSLGFSKGNILAQTPNRSAAPGRPCLFLVGPCQWLGR